jgi:hypothetical protein
MPAHEKNAHGIYRPYSGKPASAVKKDQKAAEAKNAAAIQAQYSPFVLQG